MVEWVLFMALNSGSPHVPGVVQKVDHYPTLEQCKRAADQAVMRAPDSDWVSLEAQWICLPGGKITEAK